MTVTLSEGVGLSIMSVLAFDVVFERRRLWWQGRRRYFFVRGASDEVGFFGGVGGGLECRRRVRPPAPSLMPPEPTGDDGEGVREGSFIWRTCLWDGRLSCGVRRRRWISRRFSRFRCGRRSSYGWRLSFLFISRRVSKVKERERRPLTSLRLCNPAFGER